MWLDILFTNLLPCNFKFSYNIFVIYINHFKYIFLRRKYKYIQLTSASFENIFNSYVSFMDTTPFIFSSSINWNKNYILLIYVINKNLLLTIKILKKPVYKLQWKISTLIQNSEKCFYILNFIDWSRILNIL